MQALRYCEVIADFVALDYDSYPVEFIQGLLSVTSQLRTLCPHACKGKQPIGNETEDINISKKAKPLECLRYVRITICGHPAKALVDIGTEG